MSRSASIKLEKRLPLFRDFPDAPPKNHLSVVSTVSCFDIQNRRYLGNKHKLLKFIEKIVSEKCGFIKSFCDIFAGTGVVGHHFNNPDIKIISNDLLAANHLCLKTFLETSGKISGIQKKINHLNNLPSKENYFSNYFGDAYFSYDNAKKIGSIREEIERISDTDEEKNILICALIYATDKVANTVGHYDAFRKKLDAVQPLALMMPMIDYEANKGNQIHRENANDLIKKIQCDVLYLDPPYNSRQYSDCYHILENLSEWKKPDVKGVAKKMNRDHIKSDYCLKSATDAFADLIGNANCKHILLSYNNTQESKDDRSNARISDDEIVGILGKRGKVEIFEKKYKMFTTGKSSDNGNIERIFYCEVRA